MSRIIPKNRDPRLNEFGPNDLVLNTTTGDLFIKANNKLFKITSRNQNQNISNEPVLNDFTLDNVAKLKEGKSISTGSIDVGGDTNQNFHVIQALISEIDGGKSMSNRYANLSPFSLRCIFAIFCSAKSIPINILLLSVLIP